MARGVNMAIIVGNLTRDPELRYTPAGHAVCSFGVATNRSWKTAEGERRDDAEFHNVVAWNKLAEICSQYLTKGRKVYIQGRLQTRSWEGQDGVRRSRTEIVADDMVMLGSRLTGAPAPSPSPSAPKVDAAAKVKQEIREEIKKEAVAEAEEEEISGNQSKNQRKSADEKSAAKEDVNPKEMPF